LNTGDSWDRRADAFDKPIHDESDPFIRLVREKVPLSKDFTDILDIGCGTGTMSLGFCKDVRSVKGVDISPRMVELAQRKAVSLGITNASFSVTDWDTADISRIGRFGIVLGHMTPGIHDGPTFAKMVSACSGWGFLAGYISRESPVWDRIYRIVGQPEVPEHRKLIDAQEALWLMGKAPHIEYFRRRRSWSWTPEYTKMFYTEAIRSYISVSAEQLEELYGWIDDRSVDGMFHDESDPVIGTVYWDNTESL